MAVNTYGVDTSALKNLQGRFFTRSLFWETNQTDLSQVRYYLSSTRPSGCPVEVVSLRQVYMDLKDPSEYSFAVEAFGCWEHWELLMESDFFKPWLDSYRSELAACLKSEQVKRMASLAKGGSESAAKWLAEQGWRKVTSADGGAPKRGRPSKQEVDGERRRMAISAKEDEEDAKRLGLGGR